MGEIREPWASGFGYGGLAKKIYCRTGPRFGRMPMSVSAEVWTKTELKSADNVLLVLNGLAADEQDAILNDVRVMLDHERKQLAREISQELA
jgi:hypothetical protein